MITQFQVLLFRPILSLLCLSLLAISCNNDSTTTTTVPDVSNEVIPVVPSTPEQIEDQTSPCEELIYSMIESTEIFNMESEYVEKQGFNVGLMLETSPSDEGSDFYTVKFYANGTDHITTITRFLFHPDSLQLYDDSPVTPESFDKPIPVSAHFIEKYKAQCLEKSN